MSESLPQFDGSELSEEDRQILQEFDERDNWASSTGTAAHVSTCVDQYTQDLPTNEDMIVIFVAEVEEGIALMRDILRRLEQDDHIQLTRLTALEKPAHKLRGTAGAMECPCIAELAHMIESIVKLTRQGMVFPPIGIHALTGALNALEQTLDTLVETGKESDEPYRAFKAEAEQLPVDLSTQVQSDLIPQEQQPRTENAARTVTVEALRIERLAQHGEALAELYMPLERAEEEVEKALQQLHAAQKRVDYLEDLLSSLIVMPKPLHDQHNHPTSSLIARILSEASQTQQHNPQRRMRAHPRLIKASGTMFWDELETERSLERQNILQAFREATADVTLASTHVRSAFLQVRAQTQHYMTQAATVHNDILALRSAPFRTLVEALSQEIDKSLLSPSASVNFKITGEATEVDQDILESLKAPLLQLIHTCLTDTLEVRLTEPTADPQLPRIWTHVQGVGSEVVIEIGFAMMVQGGAVDAIRLTLQHLHGTISTQRNARGGISFHIRLPRSRGAVRCLQVRVGEQHIIVPFVQVQRIVHQEKTLDMSYTLAQLLNIPITVPQQHPASQPILILPQYPSRLTIGVLVDEVEREVELMIRPLASYLQRPGITGAAIDGNSNVLLMVDLPELVRYHTTRPRISREKHEEEQPMQPLKHRQPRVLIADDSTTIRQSLLAQLAEKSYAIREAQDGIEALELLIDQPSDVFILDMDMPNLNGFDLLGIMRLYPELAHVHVVMLTSHDTQKDRQHAFELGAQVYLVKPAQQGLLPETIERLLRSSPLGYLTQR